MPYKNKQYPSWITNKFGKLNAKFDSSFSPKDFEFDDGETINKMILRLEKNDGANYDYYNKIIEPVLSRITKTIKKRQQKESFMINDKRKWKIDKHSSIKETIGILKESSTSYKQAMKRANYVVRNFEKSKEFNFELKSGLRNTFNRDTSGKPLKETFNISSLYASRLSGSDVSSAFNSTKQAIISAANNKNPNIAFEKETADENLKEEINNSDGGIEGLTDPVTVLQNYANDLNVSDIEFSDEGAPLNEATVTSVEGIPGGDAHLDNSNLKKKKDKKERKTFMVDRKLNRTVKKSSWTCSKNELTK